MTIIKNTQIAPASSPSITSPAANYSVIQLGEAYKNYLFIVALEEVSKKTNNEYSQSNIKQIE